LSGFLSSFEGLTTFCFFPIPTESPIFAIVARILAIDYGTKRTGLAVSDPLQIIATGLTTVPTGELFSFLENYLNEEEVETIVVGEPLHLDGNPSQIAHLVVGFIRKIKKSFPEIQILGWEERFTSEEAKKVILQSGVKKKKRRDKNLVDKVAATLILQDFMESRRK